MSTTISISPALADSFLAQLEAYARSQDVVTDIDTLQEKLEALLPKYADNISALYDMYTEEEIPTVFSFNAAEFQKPPADDSIKGWMKIEDGSSAYYSNRFIFDMSGKEPHIDWHSNAIAQPTITPQSFKTLVKSTRWGDQSIHPLAVKASAAGNNFALLTDEQTSKMVVVPGSYLQYFTSKFNDGVELRSNSSGSLIGVHHDGQLVGMISAVKNAVGLPSLEALKRLEQVKRDLFSEVLNELKLEKPIQAAPATENTTRESASEPQEPSVQPAAEAPAASAADTTAETENRVKNWQDVLPTAPAQASQDTENVAPISTAAPSILDMPEDDDYEAPSDLVPPDRKVDVLSDNDSIDNMPDSDLDAVENKVDVDPGLKDSVESDNTHSSSTTKHIEGIHFELGDSIASTYPLVGKEEYEALLAQRLASAVSEEHARRMIEQETKDLTKNAAFAQQQAKYFSDMYDLYKAHNSDALSFVTAQVINKITNYLSVAQDSKKTVASAKDVFERNLDTLTKVAEAKVEQSNSIGSATGVFKRNSVLNQLDNVDASIETVSTDLNIVADPREMPKMAFEADPIYLATRAKESFDQITPEDLINGDNQVDESWAAKVREKIASLKEKLISSPLEGEDRDLINKLLDSIASALKSIISIAKMLVEKLGEKFVPKNDAAMHKDEAAPQI